LALSKYTKMVQASEEFLLGDNTNWETWLMKALGRAEAVTESTLATTVLLAGATAGTAAAAQAALTIAEMERLAGTLGDGYAIEGETGYLMKRATKFYLRGIQLASAQAWNFGGEPVWTCADMPAMAQGLYSTLFGNFQLFAVLERPGMMIQRNPYLHMGTGEVDFFATIFRGYAVLQSEAFYKMAQA
jgi:HK97 family phage major capsid protein